MAIATLNQEDVYGILLIITSNLRCFEVIIAGYLQRPGVLSMSDICENTLSP